MKPILTALVGNPNVGKSTIFNELTGVNQHTGNWPGKTVAKKEGYFYVDDFKITIVDLPGAYSLTPFSPDEVIARDFILHNRPFLIIIVLDAANLERNLYLAVQVLELGIPAIIALNRVDVAQKQGFHIDSQQLSTALHAPVVPLIAAQGEGINQLQMLIGSMVSKEFLNEFA